MDDPLFDLDVNTTSQFRFLELLRRENPTRDRRLHVDPPDLRQAAVPPGRRGAPGRAGRRERHHEVRDRAAPPPLPRRLRAARDRGAPHQRVRAAPAPARRLPGLPADLRAARARRRADHGVRRRRAGARLPLRRRRRRVPAARRDRRPTPPGEIFNVGNDEHLSLRRDRRRGRRGRRHRVGSSTCPWPPDRDAIDIGSYFGDSSKAKRMLGWEPRTSFADGIAAHGRVLPRASAVVPVTPTATRRRRVPVVDLARRAAALEPELSEAVDARRALGRVPVRPRARRVRGRARRVHRPAARGRRGVGHRGAPARARRARASAPATR